MRNVLARKQCDRFRRRTRCISNSGGAHMFDFLKGGKTSVKLTLDRPTIQDGTQVYPYYPGETVHARVTLASEKEVKVREGRIALIYQEEYQYKHHHRTTDSHGHSRTTVATAWATDE